MDIRIEKCEERPGVNHRLVVAGGDSRMTYLELNLGWSWPKLVYRTATVDTPHHMLILSLGYGTMFLKMPWKNKDPKYSAGDDLNAEAPAYGFYLEAQNMKFPDTICYYRNGKLYFRDLPWHYYYEASYYLNESGEWKKGYPEDDLYKSPGFPFEYTTKDGRCQKTTIHFSYFSNISKMKLLNIPRTIYNVIIEFDDPVGEDVGTWKGGCSSIQFKLSRLQSELVDKIPIDTLSLYVYKQFLQDLNNGKYRL